MQKQKLNKPKVHAAKITRDNNEFLCCYPTAPLLKKFDNKANYVMVGNLACRSKLFLKLDLIGGLSINSDFKKVNNVYQCALCGTMYQFNAGNILMLKQENWLKVDPLKGLIYLSDGTVETVLFEVDAISELESQQYIQAERNKIEEAHGVSEFDKFNLH